MVRDNKNDKFLMYFEPTLEQRSKIPQEDEYTQIMRVAMQDAVLGTSNYKEVGEELQFNTGKHYSPMLGIPAGFVCCDGTKSQDKDFQLPGGYITHGLCIHYMMWYRAGITLNDWDKIKQIQMLYGRRRDDVNLSRIKM